MSKQVRILHCADIHFSHANPEPALQSLATIRDTLEESQLSDQPIKLVVLAGDLFDRPTLTADRHRLGDLLDAMRDILQFAPVFAVEGTPSHEPPGSYAPLERMGAMCNFKVATARTAGLTCGLYEENQGARPVPWPTPWLHDLDGGDEADPLLYVTGLPEPTRRWVMGDAGSQVDATITVQEAVRNLMLGCGAHVRHLRGSVAYGDPATIPHVHVQHGEVRGVTVESGQTLPPGGIAMDPEWFALTDADYVALGAHSPASTSRPERLVLGFRVAGQLGRTRSEGVLGRDGRARPVAGHRAGTVPAPAADQAADAARHAYRCRDGARE